MSFFFHSFNHLIKSFSSDSLSYLFVSGDDLRFQDDESLRRWKEQLLGSVDFNSVGGKSFYFAKLFLLLNAHDTLDPHYSSFC